jgi:hypothetical protein
MNDMPGQVDSSDELDFEQIHRNLLDHIKHIVTVDDLRKYAVPDPGPLAPTGTIEHLVEQWKNDSSVTTE